MRKIAIVNHKGGTGKTTTAVHLGAGLAAQGRRTLVIDLDPQGNVGIWFGLNPERSLYHVLAEGRDPGETIVTVRPNLDVLPSNHTLARLERVLATSPYGEKLLSWRLTNLQGYDFVLVDCLPSLNILNENALIFADEVIIPISMDYLSLVGVRQILTKLFEVKLRLKHQVEIMLVVPTFYDIRQRKSREVLEKLKRHFGSKVAEPIRVNVRLSEAASHSMTIFEYSPRSHGAEDYWKLVQRVGYAQTQTGRGERSAQ